MARAERNFKRMWVVVIVLISLLVATNIGWLVYERLTASNKRGWGISPHPLFVLFKQFFDLANIINPSRDCTCTAPFRHAPLLYFFCRFRWASLAL